MSDGSVLVLAYGNPLRRDDGVGWHIASLLAHDGRARAVAVLARHQLTPELAEDVSRSRLVVFVDADVQGRPPGTVSCQPLGVDSVTSSPFRACRSSWTHHLAPAELLRFARELYGRAPRAVVITVAAGSVEAGTELSPSVRAALGRAVDAVCIAINGAPGA